MVRFSDETVYSLQRMPLKISLRMTTTSIRHYSYITAYCWRFSDCREKIKNKSKHFYPCRQTYVLYSCRV